jgi:hypothetical protein
LDTGWKSRHRRRRLGQHAQHARDALERAVELARRLRWTAFIPLPESLLADVDLAGGRIEAEAARVLAAEVDNPVLLGTD